MNRLIFWYKNSRPYTAPITFLSWFVIFLYSLNVGGNFCRGLISYFGIAIIHLATNLTDDYFDYKRLSLSNFSEAKSTKCKYLRSGSASLKELKMVIVSMFIFAGCIGLYLFFVSGYFVVYFALIALFIAIMYSKLSSTGYGDIAVIIAYGPLMFEGVYYVMTGYLSVEVLFISIPCALFVETILFSSMILDYDEDYNAKKRTLCVRLNSKNKSLYAFSLLYVTAYFIVLFLSFYYKNYLYFLTFILIPLICNLFYLLNIYNKNKTALPKIKFWYYPLNNWDKIKNQTVAPYFLNFYFTRNIAVMFLILMSFIIIK